jgi:hypothetical protein
VAAHGNGASPATIRASRKNSAPQIWVLSELDNRGVVTILPTRESKHGSELRVSAMRNTNRNGNIPVIQEHKRQGQISHRRLAVRHV